MIIAILFSVFGFSFAISSGIKTCDRKPTGISVPKSTNPHPFKIVFKGNSDFYVSGTTYTSNTINLIYNQIK